MTSLQGPVPNLPPHAGASSIRGQLIVPMSVTSSGQAPASSGTLPFVNSLVQPDLLSTVAATVPGDAPRTLFGLHVTASIAAELVQPQNASAGVSVWLGLPGAGNAIRLYNKLWQFTLIGATPSQWFDGDDTLFVSRMDLGNILTGQSVGVNYQFAFVGVNTYVLGLGMSCMYA